MKRNLLFASQELCTAYTLCLHVATKCTTAKSAVVLIDMLTKQKLPGVTRQCPVQADVASKHQSIAKLQSKVQSLSDLLVQARYNHSHDLPVTAQEAAAGKTPDEQVHPAINSYFNIC